MAKPAACPIPRIDGGAITTTLAFLIPAAAMRFFITSTRRGICWSGCSRSAQGFSIQKMVPLLELLPPLSTFSPLNAAKWFTPGVSATTFINFLIRLTDCTVAVASGIWYVIYKRPSSSEGIKLDGLYLNNSTAAIQIHINKITMYCDPLMLRVTPRVYFSVSF